MEFKFFGQRITLGKPEQPTTTPPSKGKKARGARSERLVNQIEKATGRYKAKAEMDAWVRAEDRARNPMLPRRDMLIYLYDQITKDGYLTGQMTTLKNKVLSEGFAVVNKKTGQEVDEALEMLQRPWFHDFMNRYLDTDFYGHTLLNFDYPAAEGEYAGEFTTFDLIPRENVVPETGEALMRPTDAVGIPFRNTEAPYAKLLLEIILRDETGKYSLGILNKAAPEVIWKRYSRTDWSRRSEKFGMPLIGLKTDASEQSELDNKEMALANMGSNGYMLMEENEELQFLESSANQTGEMYSGLKDACNDELAFLITGQTMTSQDGSSKSQGEVHERVQEHYIQARLRSLSYFINFNLFPFMKDWGYPLEGLEFKWRRLLDEEAAKKKAAEAPTVPEGGPQGDGPEQGPQGDPGLDTPPAPPKGKGGKPGQAPKKTQKLTATPNFTKPVALASATGRIQLADTDKENPKLRRLFDQVVDKLHAERPKLRKMMRSPEFRAVMRETGDQLSQAVQEGYGMQLPELEYGTPDAVLLGKLTTHLYVFSANKSYKLLTELNALLVDDGQIRSFPSFKKEALKLHEDYNIQWLKTEYETAVATGQMAAKWLTFQDKKDQYFLKYTTVGDSRVRPAHHELDGITLPVDHTFWNTHYPPLGWKCRCNVTRVPRTGRKATDEDDLANLSQKPAEFGHNAGKTGVVFPESHQYNDIPAGAKPLLRRMATEEAPQAKPKK
jgi:SPP1 gp7 family putative phage head morphogenesis protein